MLSESALPPKTVESKHGREGKETEIVVGFGEIERKQRINKKEETEDNTNNVAEL